MMLVVCYLKTKKLLYAFIHLFIHFPSWEPILHLVEPLDPKSEISVRDGFFSAKKGAEDIFQTYFSQNPA